MKRDESSLLLPLTAYIQPVDPSLVMRQSSMLKALNLCQTLSGKDDAQFYGNGGIVPSQSQWSRIMGAGPHHFPPDKLNLFMDIAGNEAPLMWLLHSRGYDVNSLHLLETATEKKLRMSQEENAALRRVLMGVSA